MRSTILILSIAALAIMSLASVDAQVSNVTLRVASFGGHAGEVERAYVGDRMTRTTGIKIEWTDGNPSDFLAKLLASRGRDAPYDVVLLDDAVQDAAISAGVLAKLDPAEVPNLQKIYPRARNAEGYGPYAVLYSVGIVFNRDKLKAAGIPDPTSWEDLWRPELAGHLSIPDISLPQGADFVLKIAQINGGSEENVMPALEKLAKLKVQSYYTSSATLGQQLASGDVWVSVWTSGRAWALVDNGYPIGYVIPKEGSVLGIDTIDMVAGTPHPKEAQAYINMQIDPLGQLGWAQEMNYGPSNMTLKSMFDAYPDLAKRMPSSEADLDKLYAPKWNVYNSKLKAATDYWNRNVKH